MEKIEFYTQDLLNKVSKKFKKYVIIASIVLFVLILTIILTAVLVNRDNVYFFSIFSSVFGAILITIDNYILLNEIIPQYHAKKHIALIIKQTPIEINDVTIVNVSSESITLSSQIKNYEVQIKNKEGEMKIYYLCSLFDSNSLKVKKASLKIASLYITEISYEK